MSATTWSVSETVASIYDAALEPQRWNKVLARLAGLFHAAFADKYARTHDRLSFTGVAHGLDADDYQQQFLAAWSQRNPWAKRRPVKLAGEIITTRDILPREDLVRSEMYADYLDPRGLHEGMRLAIWSGETGIEDISLLRPWSIGCYTDGERELARSLMPHLRRSAEMSRRLIRAEITSLASTQALERLGRAAVVLDENGRVLHVTASVPKQLGAPDGLQVTSAGLKAASSADDNALQKAVHAATRARSNARSSTLRVTRSNERMELAVTVLPIDGEWSWHTPQRPKALVLIADPAADRPRRSAQLRQAFALTSAEAALADALLGGEDLAAIAARTHRSVNTLRTHLARVMAKTGVSRQSELVRLLLSLPSVSS